MAVAKRSEGELNRLVSMLTAEQSSLQSQRGVVQSEVLVRQGLFLTLVGTALVSLGLVAGAIGFTRGFFVVAICTLTVVAVLGVFTLARQVNADGEDYMFVLALNRIRGAYVELEPSISDHLLMSWHDDQAGAMRTYSFLGISSASSIIAMAAVFLGVVNAGIFGLLAGAVTGVASAPLWLSVLVGVVVGVLVVVLTAVWINHDVARALRIHKPRNPSPEGD